jgi:cytochrome c-type biogenesis protein
LLSLIFPQSVSLGIRYTLLYAVGFGIVLIAIAYGGRAIISRMRGASNPNGWFKKVLGMLLILTGILIMTGLMKQLEIALLDAWWLGSIEIEQSLLEHIDIQK